MAMMERPGRVVNSSGLTTLLPWISALVLVAGIVAVIITYSNNGSSNGPRSEERRVGKRVDTPPSPKPTKKKRKIPFPPAAWKVDREFMFTVLARQDLARTQQ